MLRSCKVAIVAVIGPLTMLHLDYFFILAEAAAHAWATLIFESLCTISSPWSSSQVRSWSSGNQIAGSPFSPKRKCRIAVAHAVLILLPHVSAAIFLSRWMELEQMPIPACPYAMAGKIPVLNNFIVWCLDFKPFCVFLLHFCSLLFWILTNLLCPAFASRPTSRTEDACPKQMRVRSDDN